MVSNQRDHLVLVVNAACKEADEAHLRARLSGACNVERPGRDISLDAAMRPEMRLVEPPQGLNRNVKSATAQLSQALALLDQFA